jgi:hypothetical protein
MNDACRVGGVDSIGDLANDLRNFLSGERSVTLRVALQ